jgi:hypothetical protein
MTAVLLARKGTAMPSAMVPHHPAPVFVETPRPVAQASAAPPMAEHDHDAQPHDPSRPKKLVLALSHREHERLAIAAVKTGLSRHQLVRDALDAYFEQLSRDMREGCACMSGAAKCGESCDA